MRLLPVLTLVAVPLLAAAPKPKSDADKAFTYTVARWLADRPVAEGLPIFHEEDRGKFGVEDLLKLDRRSRPDPPAEGMSWIAARPGKDGTVALSTAATNDEKGYASARLASYLIVDRFQAFELTLTGAHPRRAWIDGAPVVSGGLKKDADAKGSVKLARGTHLLLVETVFDPERRAPWSLGATLSVAKPAAGKIPAVSDATDPAREMRIEDVLDAPRVSSLAVSPDGTLAAVGLTRIVPGTDDAESWLEVRKIADGALASTWRGGASAGQVDWAPSGRRLSYVSRDRRDGKELATLWLADLDGGGTSPLLERVENLAGYRWAPDGASVVYAVTAKADPDKRGVKLRENLLDRRAGYRDKNSVFQLTLADRSIRRLTAGGTTTSAGTFSPDAKRLLLTRELEDVDDRPYTRTELWELDLATLVGKKLRDSRWMRSAQYSPDGAKILIVGGPSEFGDLGRALPPDTVANETDGEVYVLDPATGLAECLTKDFDPAVSSAYWSEHDGVVYLKATDRDTEGLYRRDASSGRFVALPAGDVVDEVSWADGAPVAVCSASGPWTPEEVYAVDLARGTSRVIARPAERAMAHVRKGTTVPMPVTLASGRKLDGRVYLPPGFDARAAASAPAIVFYYGGTLSVNREFGGRYPKEWWASNGYVVYVPQPSGAIGYGQEVSARHVNDWGEITSAEILEGTKAFLAAYPSVDSKRLGCIGASYGGFMTMRLVTETDLFAAAVSHAGISNLASYWGEGYWGWSYGALATADAFPWNRRDVYVDKSPIFAADKVKTPILLTHGASDTNVPVGESETFYTALKLTGAPVEFLTVDGQDHWILDHAKRIVWSKAILAWFDRWLDREPGAWDEMFPKTVVK